MSISLTTPALLFPALSLLLLAYTNRFLGLSSTIRALYGQYKNHPDPKIIKQIHNLRRRVMLIRNMQNEVAQIFTIDYVDFARSKGLAPMRVRVWYILRNVMISTTTLFSIGIASMLGGSVIIETVFSLPGLGSLIMSSILARDYPAVQGCVILFAVIIMAVNLLTDILYSVLDPRVKLQ